MSDEDEYPLDYFDNDDDFGPWCRDVESHQKAHRFCDDHQCAWCRVCGNGCPHCFDDPHCPECHCALNEEYHSWDCSYADDDLNDEP